MSLIMATPLSVCSREEQRSVIQFLWSEGVSCATTHHSLPEQYGNSVLLQQGVYEWTGNFKNGCTNVIREEGDGRPFTATNEGCSEHSLDMVVLDRQVTVDGVTNCLQSHGSAYRMIRSRLGFHKVCARWVTKQLTLFHKQTHWTSANIWITMVTKCGDMYLESSLVPKHGSINASRRVNNRVWSGNIDRCSARKSSKAKHPQEN
jgi:hypothetical protein